ncbi:MAG TPA: TcfC E-set like domain-containing protein [Croceibacterium sp.]
MSEQHQPPARGRLRALALACTALAAPFWPSSADAAGPAVITVGEPAGFSDLAEQTLLVDVYFGGVRRGEAKIVATPDAVKIGDPAALVGLLPAVADRAAVEAALASADLPANSGRACSQTSDRSTCGRLSPEVAGVILDRDKLRLDVFLNPKLLAVHDNVENKYLPAPAGGLSIINAIGAVLSGRSGPGRDYYNLQDQLVLGDGTRRVRADLSYATGYGVEAERLAAEWDRPELRFSAGALWAPGNELTGRRKVIGAGIESQIDTRLDKDEILGSPVVVYLDQRARVDVMRDGRVLNSAIYEAGNQQVDTSNLPEGSYQIVLRIDEPGRPTREERRFFTKSRRVPSRGRTDFFAFGGMLVDSADPGSLHPSRHPFFQGGAARRLNESWALDGEIQATDRGGSAELAATWLMRLVQVRAAVVADLDGRYGGVVQVASSSASRLSFNLDLRHIESPRGAPAFAAAPAPLPNDPLAAADLAPAGASYSQAGAIVSFSLANVRLLGVASYRAEETLKASYSVGPSMEWDVLRKGPFTLTLRGDMAATERGTSGFAGLSLRLLGGHTSMTALGGARGSNIPDDELGDGAVGSLAGSWSGHAAGGDLSLGAGYEHQPRQDDLVLSSQFNHALGSLAGDFVRTGHAGTAVSQYSLGLQTTIAAGAGGARVAGKTTTDSLIVVRANGARPGDRFEVLVNEQLAGTIVGNRPLTLALPTYRAYQVRIRPTGKDLLAYDTSPRSVGLYPGAVTRLAWKVAPVTIRFGRLVAPDGTPRAHASITGEGVWSETDDDGNFQIEAPDGVVLTATLADGRSFALSLPRDEAKDGIARLGAVTCCDAPRVRLGVLEPLTGPGKDTAK